MNTYMAFDLGGTNLKYAVIDERGTILEKGKVKTPQSDLQTLLSILHSITKTYKEKYSLKQVAMSCPGAIDTQSGYIGGESAVKYIHGPNMVDLISHSTGMEVFIENDANCAALAELWLGNAKACHDVIFVVIGSGIGGAIVKDRKIHYGKHLHGGEFGYMLVKKEPNSNRYMNWSETSSTYALIENVAKRKKVPIESLTGEEIFKLANEKDRDCIIELEEWYHTLAIGLFNLQYIYDPEIILIGGGVSENESLITELNKRVHELVINNGYAKVMPLINKCYFHNDANLIGAVYGAMYSLKSIQE